MFFFTEHTGDNFLSLQANMLSLDTRNKYRVTKVRHGGYRFWLNNLGLVGGIRESFGFNSKFHDSPVQN